MFSSHTMNDNNDSRQLLTIQHFQHSASYNQQGILGLLQLGPHVADPWLQNDSAIHGMSFPTSSSLSVGFFLPVFTRALTSMIIFYGMYLTGSSSARNLRPNEWTIHHKHIFYLAYIYLSSHALANGFVSGRKSPFCGAIHTLSFVIRCHLACVW